MIRQANLNPIRPSHVPISVAFSPLQPSILFDELQFLFGSRGMIPILAPIHPSSFPIHYSLAQLSV